MSAVPDFCEDCGYMMRPSDSGHGVCLYCRLPDLLDQQRWVALNEAAAQVRKRLTPLCVCDDCGNRQIAATVDRAATIVLGVGGQA